jgi:hypothetical protein
MLFSFIVVLLSSGGFASRQNLVVGPKTNGPAGKGHLGYRDRANVG